MPNLLRATAVALVPLLAACGGAAPPVPDSPPPPAAATRPSVDPPARPGRTAGAGVAADVAEEISLMIPVGVAADGSPIEVVVRSRAAGGRRDVVVDTPAGVVDRHIVTPDEHWWWISPAIRGTVVDAEWVHLDAADLAAAGDELPDPIADARVPLPAPGQLSVGVEVAGFEVVSVERAGPDEELLHVDGLDDPIVLRRRDLPSGTTVDLPGGATPFEELPGALRW